MKYLYVPEDGNTKQSDDEPLQEDLSSAHEGSLRIFSFNRATLFFEEAVIHEEMKEIEDEDGETATEEITYSIGRWLKVKLL
jgi:hypothetical protein